MGRSGRSACAACTHCRRALALPSQSAAATQLCSVCPHHSGAWLPTSTHTPQTSTNTCRTLVKREMSEPFPQPPPIAAALRQASARLVTTTPQLPQTSIHTRTHTRTHTHTRTYTRTHTHAHTYTHTHTFTDRRCPAPGQRPPRRAPEPPATLGAPAAAAAAAPAGAAAAAQQGQQPRGGRGRRPPGQG